MSIRVRPARPTDAGRTGSILHAFARDTAWMPELWSEAETIAHCGKMIDRGWVTVLEHRGRVEGFLARDGEEIVALYLAPSVQARGWGAVLLRAAQDRCERLHLRAFAANGPANRFYERNGFTVAGRGTGAENDENLPDIAYVWIRENVTA
ncbi:GNAT family N-acetyltransferase [Lutimaribacter marinistellae]|uniref:GNAT family N-acetyltransferase n=1 Tax=Lutimaribacter marinistellae TaxID=1820329 RepID=A0ABV7TKI2_9RHOB